MSDEITNIREVKVSIPNIDRGEAKMIGVEIIEQLKYANLLNLPLDNLEKIEMNLVVNRYMENHQLSFLISNAIIKAMK